MSQSADDFAEIYSNMSDDQLTLIAADEKSLVPEAREGLQQAIQHRTLNAVANLRLGNEREAPSLEDGNSEWARQKSGIEGWLLLWCIGAVLIEPLYTLHDAFRMGNWTSYQIAVLGAWCAAELLTAIAGVLVFLVRPYALRVVLASFLVWIPLIIFSFAATFSMTGSTGNQDYEQFGANLAEDLREVFIWTIWFVYFKVSKRVRGIFGKNM